MLADFATLRVPLLEQSFDEHLARAEQEGLAPLEFLARVIGAEADRRRERAIERRIKDARFPDVCTLADFDWKFNAQTIDRAQIEQLASCDFLRRKNNLVLVGQSGLGKPRPSQYPASNPGMRGSSYRHRSHAPAFWTRFDIIWRSSSPRPCAVLPRRSSSRAVRLRSRC